MSDDELIEAMKAAFESVADSGMWAWDDAMRAVLAVVRADADRYRKWRHEFREGSCGLWNALADAASDAEHDAAIDAAIDAARAGGEG